MQIDLDAAIRQIRLSNAFDPDYYRSENPDVVASGLDPLGHYVEYGAAEGRRPNRTFDAHIYNALMMGGRADNISAFLDYIARPADERELYERLIGDALPDILAQGVMLGRSGAFDVDYYSSMFDSDKLPTIPVLHYVNIGSKVGLRPNEHFDPAFYRLAYPDVAHNGAEPLAHYIEYGRSENRMTSHLDVTSGGPYNAQDIEAIQASGLFDEAYYRAMLPALLPKADALLHYLNIGCAHHVSPSRSFDAVFYFATVPSARSSGLPVLVHYLRHGKAAGHAILPSGRYHWIGHPMCGDDDMHIERLHSASFVFRHAILGNAQAIPAGGPAAIAELSGKRLRLRTDGADPAVSVIIPVYGQLAVTLSCLDSLSQHVSKHDFEVILFDDASPEAAGINSLAAIPWLRYIRGEQNRGFIGACNHAVTLAKGEHVVLLNSDTRICDGWLDELIDTFATFPEAGLVGSKLYNDDGSLQEAGAIVWDDGSAWNYGRNDRPDRPQYCYARQVDYCSGAAIAVPRDLWNALGGFDAHFSPAYYEDVDLAYRVREAGRQVWMQPLARVIHYEGVTHGRDETKGVKAWQVVNARKFYDRWKETLRDHGKNGVQPLQASNRSYQKRMLAIDAETPAPKRDAGSVMTFKLLQIYQRLGWHVTFIPAHNPHFHPEHVPDLQRLGVEVMCHTDIVQTLHERKGMYEAILAFRVTVLKGLIDRIRAVDPAALVLFHDIDLHYLRMEREAEIKGSVYLKRQALLMKADEFELAEKVDCTIVPSIVEQEILQKEAGVDNVIVYSYTADTIADTPDVSSRRDLVFVGGFRHSPNIDAMQFFIGDVWPQIKERLPADAKMYIIGSDAPETLTTLADDRIVFTGFLEDLGPTLETCRVFVAPLRYGAGLKGKVVTSLSYGIPCVASSIAIEGMALTPEEHVLEANDIAAFVSQIMRVYEDAALWNRLRQAGYDFVEAQYSWKTGMDVAQTVLDVADHHWHERHHVGVRAH